MGGSQSSPEPGEGNPVSAVQVAEVEAVQPVVEQPTPPPVEHPQPPSKAVDGPADAIMDGSFVSTLGPDRFEPKNVYCQRSIYDPYNYYWPVGVGAAANCVAGGFVCSKIFQSRVGLYRGRMVVAMAASTGLVAFSAWTSRRDWMKGYNFTDGLAVRNFVFTFLCVGPIAGLFGGSAVSQPSRDAPYKGSPLYFLRPVMRRYAMQPMSLGVGVLVGAWHYKASMASMNQDLEWRRRRAAVIKKRFERKAA